MKNSNLKIEINLKPTEKNYNSPGMIAYHFIDLNMIESTNFYKLFFGNKEAEDVVYRGIWDVAYIKINNVELLVPYNKLKKEPTKSCLFGAFTGENMHILTNEDAIKIAACYILLVLIFHSHQKGFTLQFNSIYGDNQLIELAGKLKNELYSDEIIGRSAFNLLD